MKRFDRRLAGLLFGAVVFLSVAASDDDKRFRGEWSLNNWSLGDSIRLKLTYHTSTSRWQWSNDRLIADLEGLTRDQLHAALVEA